MKLNKKQYIVLWSLLLVVVLVIVFRKKIQSMIANKSFTPKQKSVALTALNTPITNSGNTKPVVFAPAAVTPFNAKGTPAADPSLITSPSTSEKPVIVNKVAAKEFDASTIPVNSTGLQLKQAGYANS